MAMPLPPPSHQHHGPLTRLRHALSTPTDPTDADPTTDRATTSWLLRPLALAIARSTIALYILLSLCVAIGLAPPPRARQLAYFTTLAWAGLGAYFAGAGAAGAAYALHGPGRSGGRGRGGGVLMGALGALRTCATVLPFLVVGMYWGVLRNSVPNNGMGASALAAFTTTTTHVLPAPLALAELLLSRTPAPPWAHLPLLLGVLALYVGLAYAVHAAEGGPEGGAGYVYAFLDPRGEGGGGRVVAYCAGVGAGVVVLFLVVRGVVALRVWVTEVRWGRGGEFFRGGGQREEGREEWGESRSESVVERVEDVEMGKL
ncbi:uncharacterized protein K452DRAFT_294205 [Aplosporella prunicola CBS 121167]|uniref:Uncharacterized protein n=1 Tax=Aplosporella prunicola CBS 121167 TaxID=1176127 RepID=A0A6A6BRC5_9PEZI|nr:uncharacterized protein K452DRAFT_294205 [Aplosporella prunicola CBS 121167]KAF2146652.1 hypothetical protein K452DRAFT_294205 [Aplosporella prunicola CBS 121167]